MGIFSLFGKKRRQPDSQDDDISGSKPDVSGYPQLERRGESRLPPNQIERRVAARATALKIDAIETEMTLDILGPSSKLGSPDIAAPAEKPPAAVIFESTLSSMEAATEILLDDGVLPLGMIEVSAAGSAQHLEEAAILFASKQYAQAESMLRHALQAERSRVAWWMLFDLYRVLRRQTDFESLSIDYASQFETSPPAWVADQYPEPAQTATRQPDVLPSIVLVGRLDQGIDSQLQCVQTLAAGQLCRLEFARVTEVEPAGCALLLSALQALQQSGHELELLGTQKLLEKIRASIKAGRREESAAPWLLLLEILRLRNREKEFEEASIDYCVTFEVSPPQFEAPGSAQVPTAVRAAALPAEPSDRFMLPAVIGGDSGPLWQDLLAYAQQHAPVRFDCSCLARVEFVAAGKLLSQLAPLAGAGKTIEFHGVNHLVSVLFNLTGLNGIAKIVPHHY